MTKKNHTSYFKKILSLCLSFAMMFTTMFSQNTFVYAEDDVDVAPKAAGGFNVTLNWNTGNDLSNLKWNSNTSENKVIRLNVGYSNSSVDKGYEPGELTIVVPGIGDSNRGEVVEATDIAADKGSAEKKERDWSYTYDKATDTYTFTNNNKIEEKSNFNGSFEILWNLHSRNTINGFEKTLKATLSSADNEVESNEVSFGFASERDTYTISEKSSPLSSADKLGDDYKDFIWVNWTISSSVVTKARGTANMYYQLEIPNDAVVKFATNSSGKSVSITKKSDGYQIGYDRSAVVVTVGYPKATYTDKTIENPVRLIGKYHDESQSAVLATTNASTLLNEKDYDFVYEGKIVSVSKETSTSQVEYVKALDGRASTTFLLKPLLNNEGKVYDVVVWDDILDVTLSDGSFRRLTDTEYDMTHAVIPAASNVTIGNAQKLDPNKYTVEIYTRVSGSNEYILLDTKQITNSEQLIELPQDTVGIQFKLLDIDVSLKDASFIVVTKFSIDDSSNTINQNGYIRNLAAVDLYENDIRTNLVEKESYVGSWANEIAERDMDLYGMYMQRGMADIHFYLPNTNVTVGTNVYSDAFSNGERRFNSLLNIDTNFSGKEATVKINKFSQYTILPKGLSVNIDDFAYEINTNNVTFLNGSNVSASYIESHVNASIIENYKDSGKTLIKFDYDFSDRPVYALNSSIRASFETFVTDDDYLEFGESYTTKAVSLMESYEGNLYGNNLSSVDNGSYFTNESTLWNDLDGDNQTNELITYDIDTQSILLALSSYQELQKSVMSNNTDNEYVLSNALALLNDAYSYKVKFRTGNSAAKNIVIYDTLEAATGSEWQGTFKNVDLSYLESKGYTPTVYYSSVDNAGNLVDNAENWSTTKPDTVKAIAVSLGEAVVGVNSLLYFVVNMTTPNDDTLLNKKTINEFNVSFMSLDMTGIETGQTQLASNVVEVKLVDSVGDLTVIKKDATSGAKLGGAEFDLYKGSSSMNKVELLQITQEEDGSTNLGFSYENGVYKSLNALEGCISAMESNVFTINEQTTVSFEYATGNPGSVADYFIYDVQNEDMVYEKYDYISSNESASNESSLVFDTISVELQAGTYILYLEHFMGYYEDGSLNHTYFRNITYSNSSGSTPLAMSKSGTFGRVSFKKEGEVYKSENTEQFNSRADIKTDVFEISSADSKFFLDYALSGEEVELRIYIYDYETGEQVTDTYYFYPDSNVESASDLVYETFSPDLPEGTYYIKMRFYINYVSSYLDTCYLKNVQVSGLDMSNKIKTIKTNSLGKATINNLDFGDYFLLETKAPEGYTVNSQPIMLTIDSLQKEIVVDNERLLGSTQLHKTSEKDKTIDVSGAIYDLYKETDSGNILIEEGLVTDSKGLTSPVSSLEWGSYYFIETLAAPGYELNTNKVKFEINKNNVANTVVVETHDKEKAPVVVLNKTEVLEDGTTIDKPVSNAYFDLYDSNNKLLYGNLKTNEQGKIVINDLSYGNYYFKETSAKGYIVNDDKINFSVDPNKPQGIRSIITNLDVDTNDGKYPWTLNEGVWKSGNQGINSISTITLEPFTINEKGSIKFDWAVSSESSDYLYYTIIDKNGTTVSGTGTSTKIGGNSWVTNEIDLTYTHVEKELEPGTYTLSFTYYKNRYNNGGLDTGYVKNILLDNEKLAWTSSVDSNNNMTCNVYVSNNRKLGNVTLIKTNEINECLSGVKFSLYNNSDELIKDDLVTNTEGQINLKDLAWGNYYLLEKETLDGYELNTKKYEFIIDRDSVESTVIVNVVNNRIKGKVNLTKVDETDETITLPGAVYTLYDIKDNIVKDDLTTDANGQIKLDDLEWGSYYFLEKKAPTSYSLSDEKIRFSVNAENAETTQELIAKDSMIQNCTITITKRITVDDIWLDHGLPTFLYKVVGTDILGNETTYYSQITFSKDYINNHIADEIIELSTTIAELPVGTYVVEELNAIRYNLSEVTDVVGGFVQDKIVTFNLAESVIDGKATFVNEKFINSDYSHNDNTKNIIKGERVPTSIKLEASFETLNEETIDRNKLAVTLFYDDGTSRVLGNEEYILNQETFDISMNGSYTLIATYSEKGKTMKDALNITVEVRLPFSADVYNASNSMIGTYSYKDGLVLNNSDVPAYLIIRGYTGNSNTVVFPSVINGIKVKALNGLDVNTYYTPISGLDNVTSIVISEGIEIIGNRSFENYTGLTNIIISEGVTRIDDYAFSNCSGITGDLKIPNSVTSIGGYAFRNCTGLNGTLTIGDNVSYISGYAFTGCRNLTGDLVIPSNVTEIQWRAFRYCTGLSSISILNKNTILNIELCPTTITLKGYSGSTAETYATNNGNPFVALE